MNLVITDNLAEMIEIGKRIVEEKADIYSPMMLNTIKEVVKSYNSGGGLSDENLLYKSVYDYWVYGNTCDEEFYYDFVHKNHNQKMEYMTFRMREKYCQHINRMEDAELFVDKYKTYQKFKEYYLRDVIQINSNDDYEEFLSFVKKHPSFVVKPKDMAFGVGVYLVKENDYNDYHTLFESIRKSGEKTKAETVWAKTDSLVLEEIIDQDDALARIHPYSVNGIRVPTIKIDNDVIIYHPWLKVGANRQFVTSAVFGTMDAGINADTGIVETNGFKENGENFEYHPDTGIRIKGLQIPKWQELVQIAKQLAGSLDSTNYIGWDFALTPKGWCVMEANFDGDFMWQLYYGKGMKREFEELIGWKYDKQFWWE